VVGEPIDEAPGEWWGIWACGGGEADGVVDRLRVVFVVTDYFSCAASWPASFSASP